MAVSSSFAEANVILSPPEGVTAEECETINVWRGVCDDHRIVISCWKLTIDELAEVNRTGRLWLGCWGSTMPPVWLSGQNPFGTQTEYVQTVYGWFPIGGT